MRINRQATFVLFLIKGLPSNRFLYKKIVKKCTADVYVILLCGATNTNISLLKVLQEDTEKER